MATPEMVATNVRTAFEALGMQEPEGGVAQAAREAEALREVQSMLSGVRHGEQGTGKLVFERHARAPCYDMLCYALLILPCAPCYAHTMHTPGPTIRTETLKAGI